MYTHFDAHPMYVCMVPLTSARLCIFYITIASCRPSIVNVYKILQIPVLTVQKSSVCSPIQLHGNEVAALAHHCVPLLLDCTGETTLHDCN